MDMGLIVLIIGLVVGAIWVFFLVSRWNHKIVTIVVIGVIVFLFMSFIFAFKGQEVSVSSFEDFGNFVKVYLSWMGNAFDNVKLITTQAIKMDWKGNSTT